MPEAPMSRRRLLLGAGVLLVVLAGALAQPGVRWPLWGWLRGEPFYRGKPTSYWAERLRAETCNVQTQTDPPWNGLRLVTCPALSRRPPLIDAFYRYVRVNRSAPPEVLFEFSEADRLVPVLIQLLKDPDRSVVAKAALCLWHIGPAAWESTPALSAALAASTDTRFRMFLADCRERVDPKSKEALDPLIGLLLGPDKSRAAIAAARLGEMGPDAEAAVLPLAMVLTDSDPRLSAEAAKALKQIDPQWPAGFR
jgi:hypothetical protein